MQPILSSHRNQQRLKQILNPSHPLRKEDILWILEFVKKKVADEDPRLLELSQPRLLRNFHCFAEIAMILIHKTHAGEREITELKTWIYEAVHGLYSENEK